MLPFRDLLKKGNVFCWTQDLDDAFRKAKLQIVDLMKDGVKSFETGRVTAINTDWSKTGIGFTLLQKHCDCSGVDLQCCKAGWKLFLVGSRFCTGAESRYAPIEGEALGVPWALDKARHYVMGCPALYVGVDHKPLLGLYSSGKALADISNSRLPNLVEKATRFRFHAFYVKGAENSTPDALSRYPSEGVISCALAKAHCAAGWLVLAGWGFNQCSEAEVTSSEDLEEEAVLDCQGSLDSMGCGIEDEFGGVMAIRVQSVTWEQMVTEAKSCPSYQKLVWAVLNNEGEWPLEV